MIRYALACEQAHEFESWFPSGEAYDAQQARGLVTCPVCDSKKIAKQIMAPSVARTDRAAPTSPAVSRPGETPAAPATAPEVAPPTPPSPVALLSERERAVRAMLKAVREHVTRNAEDVGPRFVEEARKMHHGEIDHRSIYGEASAADARTLLEEGIEVHPLPTLPDDRN